jgi:hypothetical protein
MEANSLETVAMHLRHFIATLGENFPLPTLTLTQLQQHVDRRSKKKGIRGRPLSPVTLRKEMPSLRAAWNWAALSGYVAGAFPNKGLKYPKSSDKPSSLVSVDNSGLEGLADATSGWAIPFLPTSRHAA